MNATLLKDLPAQLKDGECFVAWRYEERGGKKTKVPVNPRTGGNASVTDPSTWSSLKVAIGGAGDFACCGVGRVVVAEDGYCGVDLDNCRNPQTGELTPMATAIVKTLNSYTEITPSCCGVRVWILATQPGRRCRKDGVEIYAGGRYFTLTGNHLPNTPKTVEPRQAELEQVYNMLFPGKAKAASNGRNKETHDPWTRWRRVPDDELLRHVLKNPKFKQLWDGDTSAYGSDDSRADAALCCHLAFWTGKDPERIERLFNQSKLAERDKWRKREDYRRRTISNAIDSTTEVWTPNVGHVQAATENDWPDPSPLGDDLPPVDSLALELLPQSLRPFVEDISDRMQTPPDFAAIAGIVALAGCVNRRALIHPKVEDNWTVTPNLWGAIIGHPGFMKSPILRATTAPLAHIEEMWRAEYDATSGDYEMEKEKVELRFQAWREQFKAAEKHGKTPPTQPDNTLKEPTLRRLLLTDATFEALHEILSKNPARVLVTRDELTSWISTLDRSGREGERGFFLQSWNGDSDFTIDRVGRGSIYVPAVCVSLLGCIQPSRLRWYLSQSLDGGPSDDGLLQRFQLATWPDPPRDWKLIDRTPNNTALGTAEKVFTVLANLSADSPIRLHFDPEAQQLFFLWWSELERKIRTEAGLHTALVAHLAKYRSLLPTLAGLFELADAVAQSRDAVSINLAHAQQAAAWCEYLESHAKRIYSCVTSPEAHAARLLAGHIERGDLGETFSTREVYALHHWTGLDTPERVRAAIDVLEDAAWVREFNQKPEKGRPSETWQVNPKVARNAK